MDWVSYVKSELARNNSLSELKITYGDEAVECVSTPPIIKVSIELLNRFFEAGEKRVVMVFPEKNQSTFFLVILKVIHDIIDGKLEKIYNPNTFVKGQKLKCGNCVVEFDRIDRFMGRTTLWVENADCRNGIPLELAPFFQLTDTNRCLSTDKEFSKIKGEIKKQKAAMVDSEQLTTMLIDYKTHLNNTVFNVTPIGKVKAMMSNICINGNKVQDILLVGQVDTEGNVENINRGQLLGEPSIVMASNMYSVYEAIKKESDVKSLFIDVSNPNTINNELDVLDEILKKNFPIICLTDTLNSFELESLESRGFSIWRWDEESISIDMHNGSSLSINKKVQNCSKQKIQYLECDSEEISSSLAKLYLYRKEVALTNVNMTDIYDKLFSLAFLCLRNIVDLNDTEYTQIKKTISNCKIKLQSEKRFISSEMFNNFEDVIKSFQVVYSKEYVMPKISALKDVLCYNHYKNVCIVIQDRADKEKHQVFWDKVCSEENIQTKISILRQAEYCNSKALACDITIVCGWISSTIMRRIIYSYNTSKYIVLLYEYEERWRNAHVRSWNSILHKYNKTKVIEKIFGKTIINDIDIDINQEIITIPEGQGNHDELSEIEMVLQENKYRKYLINGGNKNIDEVVDAVPVNFVGGCFAFYKTTHKLVSVTEIVLEEKDDIKTILPSQLKIGDFIVVRESQHDLVKDFADIILLNSGQSGLREFASKWKDSLRLESVFSKFDDIYVKLRKVGCTKSKLTVRLWMKNEDIISPQNINDLKYIAEATEDNVLLEQLESIFDAGAVVKRAHIQAGRILSELLKRKVAQKIQELGEIDPYNIWEPITLYLDEIGTVKILKVIDIGNVMAVDESTTNNLISEY